MIFRSLERFLRRISGWIQIFDAKFMWRSYQKKIKCFLVRLGLLILEPIDYNNLPLLHLYENETILFFGKS